ncbi:unnamed protein product [Vitrella brassicaformis CCMP3155]|uniref:FAD-dependent oxidoreductase domain-containing protein 1 n=1 Tax=Vitrella brassicaformis (strain CCMP3155) TaxID=1169540 RepID=A0A0G4FKW9_VITBC|nr:unnamed protein product [Vitrella brassicaformis CCMP3155]|eukprot:CEM14611.1 unnamed protein product [Vitrella brassicaformis CCMP3155]
MGSATAYFLAKYMPSMAPRVLVVERDKTYIRSSTTRSAASIRHQFSLPENITMSQFGTHFLSDAPHALARSDEDPIDICFRETGYLFLSSPAGLPTLEENHAVQLKHGCSNITMLDAGGLKKSFPWLSTEGLAGGTYGTSGEGSFDAESLLHAIKNKAISMGVRYVSDEVVDLVMDPPVAASDKEAALAALLPSWSQLSSHRRVTHVCLQTGGRVACGTVVNCAGGQAARIAAMAGLSLPVRARKRCIFVVDVAECPDGMSEGCPLTVLDQTSSAGRGVYFRKEGCGHNRFITGMSPLPDEDVDALQDDFDVPDGLFEECVWPALASRVPAFEALRCVSCWAGHYEMNLHDHNAVMGASPNVDSLLFCNGFSGHGLQHAPAAGRAIAELILCGRWVSIDLSLFAFDRLIEGRTKVLERNIV